MHVSYIDCNYSEGIKAELESGKKKMDLVKVLCSGTSTAFSSLQEHDQIIGGVSAATVMSSK